MRLVVQVSVEGLFEQIAEIREAQFGGRGRAGFEYISEEGALGVLE